MTCQELIKKIQKIQSDGSDNEIHILDGDGTHFEIDSVQLDADAIVLEMGSEVEEDEEEEEDES